MNSKIYFIVILFLFIGCNKSINKGPESVAFPYYSEGISPISAENFPFDINVNNGVAKLYKGNNYATNGIFISQEGLLITNYSSIMELMSSSSEPGSSAFKNGFIAGSKDEEVALPGISLLVEIEQKDVTDEVRVNIADLSPNYEVYQTIQTQKNKLISERRGANENLFVEIKDSFSGNSHIMTVYLVIRDIRLVYAPLVDIDQSNAHESNELLDNITDRYTILRAYQSPSGKKTEYSQQNVPFNPVFHFPISEKEINQDELLTAFGFPNQTYRLEGSRAIEFYNKELNPIVISSFETFLKKEDSLSSVNESYAINSIPSRFNLAQNVSFFETAQQVISEHKVIENKRLEEKKFIEWAQSDSTLPIIYSSIYTYIDQAYDLAEQTSTVYFTSSYFNSLSMLDDLAAIYRNYVESASDLEASTDVINLKRQALTSHQELLTYINSDAELYMLHNYLLNFAALPEEQRPLFIFDLFYSNDNSNIETIARDFIANEAIESFLFNLDSAVVKLNSNDISSDPLFTLLDEIAFSFESSKQSYQLHYQYLFPAQQILTRAKMDHNLQFQIHPDANTSLSFNVGSLKPYKESVDDSFIYTTNDFSGKASGNAVLNTDGDLVGMISDEINDSVLGNYMYNKDASFVKSLRISSIMEELRNSSDAAHLLEEIRK